MKLQQNSCKTVWKLFCFSRETLQLFQPITACPLLRAKR